MIDPQRHSATAARPTRPGFAAVVAIAIAAGLVGPGPVAEAATTLAEAEQLYRSGQYEACAAAIAAELGQGGYHAEPWYRWKIEAERARGQFDAAIGTTEEALRRNPTLIPLRLLAYHVYREAGRDDEAAAMLGAIERLVRNTPRQFDTPEGRVALGRFFALRGADARQILDRFFDAAIRQNPDLIDAYLAVAELALGKSDLALAASTLDKAPADARTLAEWHALRARALIEDERPEAIKALGEALKINPNHVPSLLQAADARIDNEDYDEAGRLLARALDVNPAEPRAWAYRAVLAHLRSDPQGEADARAHALSRRPRNPEVDHIIGRELARKYRFREGADAQRRALEADPGYLPALDQLCQDWLRLGDEDAGWQLADRLHADDAYNVQAFNLTTLRDKLRTFRTLHGDGLVVRMDPREADLYGDRVLALLAKARATLGAKYEIQIEEPVTVEVFPSKKDFAVRTFGLPGAEGFLGVCFGRVITANSPASQGEHPTNWESVLWHEYCHAVTLGKTRNKMPRWLSEGISVYEEGQANPAWRSSTDPRYRAMMLGDDLFPLSRLSAAFLAPKSGLHLQFAYHESALAVDFLVRNHGLPALRGILADLGDGKTINDALAARTGRPLDDLDAAFQQFAHQAAEAIAPGSTWEEVKLADDADSATLRAFLKEHPANYPAKRRLAGRLVAEGKGPEARPLIDELEKLDPNDVAPGNIYELRAALARKAGDAGAERAALDAWASRDGSTQVALIRLAEIDEAAADWVRLADDARRLLAVNPLVAAPHRWLAQAAERLGAKDEAIAAYRAWAALDATDPAEVHYRLARLLAGDGRRQAARREVLKALEAAPRFRDAHKLLLELVAADAPPPDPTPTPTPEPPRGEARP